MRSRLAKPHRHSQRPRPSDDPRGTGHRRDLRGEIDRLVRQAQISSRRVAVFARRLGGAPVKGRGARPADGRAPRAVRPVVVAPVPTAHPAAIVTLPSGLRIEGLAVAEITALVRALA